MQRIFSVMNCVFTGAYYILSSPFGKVVTSAFVSYSAHYAATKIYSMTCIPAGFYGFLQGLVTFGSPVCQAGVQMISATQVSYSAVIMMGLSRMMLDLVAPTTYDAVVKNSAPAPAPAPAPASAPFPLDTGVKTTYAPYTPAK